MKPKVTLVGAGPGDPDLMTLKGVKALAEANVVLYDALANEEILEYAPKNAIRIFVGKRIEKTTENIYTNICRIRNEIENENRALFA